MKYKQRKNPCPACPYVQSTASGIWAREEYEKLPKYDPGQFIPDMSVFQCHHTSEKKSLICQGWLDCHGADELIGIRLAHIQGRIPDDFDYEPSEAVVYASGQEAMEFGVRDIENPSDEALEQIDQLSKMKRIKDARPPDNT